MKHPEDLLELFAEESQGPAPEEYLAEQWAQDPKRVRAALGKIVTGPALKQYRGLADCVCQFALQVRDPEITALIETIATRTRESGLRLRCLSAGLRLGSDKAVELLTKHWDKLMAVSLDSREYDDFSTVLLVRTVIVQGRQDFAPFLRRLWGKRDEQYHRRSRFPVFYFLARPLSYKSPAQLARWDCQAVKYAAAGLTLFESGLDAIAERVAAYSLHDNEAYHLLYCLGASRRREYLPLYRRYVEESRDGFLQILALEALVLASEKDEAADYIAGLLHGFVCGKPIIQAHSYWSLEMMLCTCLYLPQLTPGLNAALEALQGRPGRKPRLISALDSLTNGSTWDATTAARGILHAVPPYPGRQGTTRLDENARSHLTALRDGGSSASLLSLAGRPA